MNRVLFSLGATHAWSPALACVCLLVGTVPAMAHFIFLQSAPTSDGREAQLLFTESPRVTPDRLPERVRAAEVWRRDAAGPRQAIELSQVERGGAVMLAHSLAAATSGPLALEARCDYGVYQTFRLTYFAKHLHGQTPQEWAPVSRAVEQDLDIQPSADAAGTLLTVTWQGKPAAEVPITLIDAEGQQAEHKTDAQGRVVVNSAASGPAAAIAHYVDAAAAGELDGKTYRQAHYYATLTWPHQAGAPSATGAVPDLPAAVASFGATTCGDAIYVYGGHIGQEHEHSVANVVDRFQKFVAGSDRWQELPADGPAQGVALVAHAGAPIRVGGMAARNESGAEEDLHSSARVARFDEAQQKWIALADLPEPRSSHDATVMGDTLYVVGGWTLSGSSEGSWSQTALALDLSQANAEWTELPKPPFQKRALACAEYQGKLMVIGGMTADHKIDRSVHIYDPATQSWSSGPEFPGRGMNGFGVSAWNYRGQLVASGSDGQLYRLSPSGDGWELVTKLQHGRFFHRLVTGPGHTLWALGGASHESGHLSQSEALSLPADGKPLRPAQ